MYVTNIYSGDWVVRSNLIFNEMQTFKIIHLHLFHHSSALSDGQKTTCVSLDTVTVTLTQM